jgi:hypothetical protein
MSVGGFGRSGSRRAHLDEVLALGLGDERLQLGRRERVDEARLGDDEKQHLGSGKDGQLIGLDMYVLARNAARVLFLMQRG